MNLASKQGVEFVLVPKAPTKDMGMAALKFIMSGNAEPGTWAVMLAAAPPFEPSGAMVEGVARLIDPSAWAVMDGYLEETQRKYKGQNVGWPTDQFRDTKSMTRAAAILAHLFGRG